MKIRGIFSYFLLFGVSAGIFFVVLFPGQQIAAYVSQTLTKPESGIYTQIVSLKPSLPFSLKSEDTRISIGRDMSIHPEFIKIRLGPGLVFGSQKQVNFITKLSKGVLKGSIGFEDRRPIVYTNADLSLSGFEFDKVKYDTRMANITMSGKIDGDYRYTEKTDNKIDPGQGNFIIRDFSADLRNSLLNRLKLPEIDFTKIDIQFTQDQQNINLIKLEAVGSVIHIRLNGIIRLEKPPGNSRLILSGAVLPDSPYLASFANSPAIKALVKNIKKDGIRFTLNGTLQQPEIKI